MEIMDRMAEKNLTVDGQPTSLVELGYNNCGLDDAWQACGAGYNHSFDDENGNPLINDKFPNMTRMTDHGHSKNIRVGWYMVSDPHVYPRSI